jgi:hypothetical protein
MHSSRDSITTSQTGRRTSNHALDLRKRQHCIYSTYAILTRCSLLATMASGFLGCSGTYMHQHCIYSTYAVLTRCSLLPTAASGFLGRPGIYMHQHGICTTYGSSPTALASRRSGCGRRQAWIRSALETL